MSRDLKYIGMDVHKEAVVISVRIRFLRNLRAVSQLDVML